MVFRQRGSGRFAGEMVYWRLHVGVRDLGGSAGVYCRDTPVRHFSPRVVFFVCSLLGAVSNILTYWMAEGLTSLLVLRFITGFFLAGIYPVG